jgi:hypothetical protein
MDSGEYLVQFFGKEN